MLFCQETDSANMIRTNDILKEKIYIIIFRSDTRAGKLFDVVLLVLILLSILSVFLESVGSVRERFYQTIHDIIQ